MTQKEQNLLQSQCHHHALRKKKKKRGHGINYFPYSASIFGQHVSHLFSAIMELNATTNLYHIYPDVPRSLIGSHVEWRHAKALQNLRSPAWVRAEERRRDRLERELKRERQKETQRAWLLHIIQNTTCTIQISSEIPILSEDDNRNKKLVCVEAV